MVVEGAAAGVVVDGWLGDSISGEGETAVVGAAGAGTMPGRHWEYHSLSASHTYPSAQQVGPAQPLPPHLSQASAQAPPAPASSAAGDGVGAATGAAAGAAVAVVGMVVEGAAAGV